MTLKVLIITGAMLFLTSCLKTRTDVAENDQNEIYSRKNAENQMESQSVEDKNELIRNLNGRLEVLEQQFAAVQSEKEMSSLRDSQRIILLQEAVAKLEIQVQKMENQVVDSDQVSDKDLQSSDDQEEDTEAKIEKKTKIKKLNSYELAEEQYKKREWKKSIISYQKYTDETPKGKFVADAKYKIGLCFQELGMKDEAMAFYEEVVANYAKTEAGKKSKTRLAKLKK